MINTFKPFCKIIKRTKNTHDWFGFHIYICNEISLSISVFGYGIRIGALIFDVMKGRDDEDG